MESPFERILSEIEVMDPVSIDGFQLFGLKRAPDELRTADRRDPAPGR